VKQLTKYGREATTPIALIRWGTRIEQETLVGTLADIVQKVEKLNFGSPAIIIVGEVVRLREKLAWFEHKPLFGKRILVTRARSQSSELTGLITNLGGEAIEFPVIRIVEPERGELLNAALHQLAEYDWVIFTSVNGVKHFFDRIQKSQLDIRQMYKARLAAIGPKTAAALSDKGLLVKVLPEEYKAEALVEHLRPFVQAGEKILLPRADIARKVLAEELRDMGCDVTEVDAYDTQIDATNAEEIVQMLERGQIDVLTFTSSSTVRNFIQAIGSITTEMEPLLQNTQIACIGPITAKTAESLGLRVDVMAKEYTIDGLIEAIKTL
jgi:uroporphyrinogen III methyltransferase/synthase